MFAVHGITLQLQPTPGSCVQTCLAMALDVPVARVIERYGSEPMNQHSLSMALTECRFRWNQFVHGTILCEGWHFLVVPSLNKRGGHHQVLMHWSGDTGLTIMDPAMGDTYAPDGSDLVSWSYLTPFALGGQLP